MQLPSIFLSYSRKDDEPFVKHLYESLIGNGFRVWWDRVSMPNRALTFLQEIRDAIDNSDCLVLVVGPGAVGSDYVRAEWQHALEYCKPVHPILRLSDFTALPSELKLLDTPDFRDDDQYQRGLEHLLRHLNELTAPLGKLVAVPELPPHFLVRPADLSALKQQVLVDVQKPIVVTGTARRIGLHGMGGIGKSVLGAALARDCDVRHAFPDGVFWITIGQSPNLTSRQYDLCLSLSVPPPHPFSDETAGKAHLSTVLADKACLFILDDIWQLEHALAFDALGPRCRMLLTTRDAALIVGLGAHEHRLEVLSEDDALTLMAGWLMPESSLDQRHPAGIVPRHIDLPEIAREVAHECGYLPLALALIAAQVRDGAPWKDLLDALREADLSFFDHPHGSILKSLKVSIDALQQANMGHAQHYMELAVFAEDTPIPEAAVLTLWLHSNNLNERQARQLIRELSSKALIRLTGEQSSRLIELHDLQHLYLRRTVESLSSIHDKLVEAYRRKSPLGWHTGPNDGYFFERLPYHLHEAGRKDELYDLLTRTSDWMERKYSIFSGDAVYLGDIDLAISDFVDPLTSAQILRVAQLCAVKVALNARTSLYSDTDVELLVLLGREIEALNHVRLRTEPKDRFHGLLVAYRTITMQGRTVPSLYEELHATVSLVADPYERVISLCDLALALIDLGEPGGNAIFKSAQNVAYQITNALDQVLAFEKLQTVVSRDKSISLDAVYGELTEYVLQIGYPESSKPLADWTAMLVHTQDSRRVKQIARVLLDQAYEKRDFHRIITHNRALHYLTKILVLAEEYDKATRVLYAFPLHASAFPPLAQTLAVALARAGQFDLAVEIANLVSNEHKGYILVPVAAAFAEVGYLEQARILIQRILAYRSIWESRETRLSKLIDALSEVGNVGEALQLLPQLKKDDKLGKSDDALRALVAGLSKARRFDEAVNLFHQMRNRPFGHRAKALSNLVSELSKARRFDEAVNLFHQMRNHPFGHRANALSTLVSELSRAGRFDQAIDLFNQTGKGLRRHRANVLSTLVSELSRAEHFNQAIDLFYQIEEFSEQDKAMYSLVSNLRKSDNHHASEFFDQVHLRRASTRNTNVFDVFGQLGIIVRLDQSMLKNRTGRWLLGKFNEKSVFLLAKSIFLFLIVIGITIITITTAPDSVRMLLFAIITIPIGIVAFILVFFVVLIVVLPVTSLIESRKHSFVWVKVLLWLGRIDQAMKFANQITHHTTRSMALCAVITALAKTGNQSKADTIFQQVEEIVFLVAPASPSSERALFDYPNRFESTDGNQLFNTLSQ